MALEVEKAEQVGAALHVFGRGHGLYLRITHYNKVPLQGEEGGGGIP